MNHVHLRVEKARHTRRNAAQRQRVGLACIVLLLRSVLYRARLMVIYWRGVYAAQRKAAEQAARIAAMSPSRRRRLERRAAARVAA